MGEWPHHSANCCGARWLLTFLSCLCPYTSFSVLEIPSKPKHWCLRVFWSVCCLHRMILRVCNNSDHLRLEHGPWKQGLSTPEIGIVPPAPRGCLAWSVQLLLTLLHELPGPCVPQQRALESRLAWAAEELKLFQSGLGKGLSEGSKGLAACEWGESCLQTYPLKRANAITQVCFPFWQTVLYLHRENKDSPQIEELVNHYSR